MTLATAEGGLQRTASRLSNRSGRSQNRRPSKLESVQYPAIDVLADQRGFGISPHLVYFKVSHYYNPVTALDSQGGSEEILKILTIGLYPRNGS